MLALLILSSPPRSFFKACQKLHQIVFFIQNKVFPLDSQASFFFFYDTPWQTNRIILAISLIASHWLASLFHRKGFCWPCTYISFWSYWRARCIQFMLLAHSAIYLVLMWWEIYFRCWKHCLENNFQSKDERYDHCFLCVSGWSGLPFLLEHIQMLGRFLYSRFGCFTSYRSKEMFTSSCG